MKIFYFAVLLSAVWTRLGAAPGTGNVINDFKEKIEKLSENLLPFQDSEQENLNDYAGKLQSCINTYQQIVELYEEMYQIRISISPYLYPRLNPAMDKLRALFADNETSANNILGAASHKVHSTNKRSEYSESIQTFMAYVKEAGTVMENLARNLSKTIQVSNPSQLFENMTLVEQNIKKTAIQLQNFDLSTNPTKYREYIKELVDQLDREEKAIHIEQREQQGWLENFSRNLEKNVEFYRKTTAFFKKISFLNNLPYAQPHNVCTEIQGYQQKLADIFGRNIRSIRHQLKEVKPKVEKVKLLDADHENAEEEYTAIKNFTDDLTKTGKRIARYEAEIMSTEDAPKFFDEIAQQMMRDTTDEFFEMSMQAKTLDLNKKNWKKE